MPSSIVHLLFVILMALVASPVYAQIRPLGAMKFSSSSELIQIALKVDLAVMSHDDWHLAGLENESLLRQFRQLAFQSNFSQQTCSELTRLSFDELTLFTDVINSPLVGPMMECQDELKIQLEEGYELSRQKVFAQLNQLKGQPGPGKAKDLVIDKVVRTLSGPIYYDADLAPKQVALTFDDGPHPSRTPALLDILKDAGVQVTFFSVGQNIRRMPQIMKRIADDGHSVGTHSYTHPDMRKLSRQAGEDEIFDAVWELVDAIGFSDPFFRFPYGADTTYLQDVVKQSKMGTFFWNIDTLDWKKRDPEELYNYALAQVDRYQRGIVLFHDIQRQTIEMMPAFIEALKHKGYQFVVFRSPDTIARGTGPH